MINLQISDTWRIQLTIAINFISSKDVDEDRVIHSKSDNIEFIPYNNVSEVVNELFESLLSRYQIGLETSMRESDFIFVLAELLHYKSHKINFNREGSHIDSPDWIKKKKATINPKNEDHKFFQCGVTVALNHEEIKKDPKRISKLKPFIQKHDWNGTKYPLKMFIRANILILNGITRSFISMEN